MKKLVSIILVLAMTFSFMGISVQAEGTAPFALTAELSQDGKTVTVTISTNGELAYGSADIIVTAPSGFSWEAAYTQGTDFADFKTQTVTTNNSYDGDSTKYSLGITTVSANENYVVATGKSFVILTANVPDNVSAGSYTFSAYFESLSDYDGEDITGAYSTITSNTITIGTEDTSCQHTNTTHHEADPATCLKAGTIEYWICNSCGLMFSDATCTTQVTDITDPQKEHNYTATEKCTNGCDQLMPAYTVSYKLFNSTSELTTDADGKYLVDRGTEYTAKVFITSSTTQTLQAFELNLTYDSTNVTVTNDTDVQLYGTVKTESGAIKYTLVDRYNLTDTSPQLTTDGLQVAQFKFTVNDNVALDSTMTFSFGSKNEVNVVDSNSTQATAATTVDTSIKVRSVTVTWNANEGTFSEGSATSQKLAYDSTLTAPTVTRTGYTLEGWYASNDTNKTLYGGTSSNTTFPNLMADTTYVAQWKINNYTITYDSDGGTLSGEKTSYTITDTYELPTPIRKGYTFEGWTITNEPEDNRLTKDSKLEKLDKNYGNVEVKASWKINEYTITYKLDGGSLTIGDDSIEENGTSTYTTENGPLVAPTKAGYRFKGWKVTEVADDTNLNKDEVIEAGDTALNTKYGDVTLTATWELDIYYTTVTDFGYAPTGYQLLIVSAADVSNKVIAYDGTALFHISANDSTEYAKKLTQTVTGAGGVYVTLVEIGTDETIDVSKLSLIDGPATTLDYTLGQIDSDDDADYNDASIVNELNKSSAGGDAYTLSALDIQHRLLSDVNKDCKATVDDVTALMNLSAYK
jgi:uncharacterized repeat protein (TIGR02543 family)